MPSTEYNIIVFTMSTPYEDFIRSFSLQYAPNKPTTFAEINELRLLKATEEFIIEDISLDCDPKICVGDIPATVKTIVFKSFIPEIEQGAIPDSVTHMDFILGSKNILDIEGVIPGPVTHININSINSDYLGMFEAGDFPETVTHMQISCRHFPKNLCDIIPQSLTHLSLLGSGQINLRKHPNITHLFVPNYYKNEWPPNLEHLYMRQAPYPDRHGNNQPIFSKTIKDIYCTFNKKMYVKGTDEFNKLFEIDHGLIKSAII